MSNSSNPSLFGEDRSTKVASPKKPTCSLNVSRTENSTEVGGIAVRLVSSFTSLDSPKKEKKVVILGNKAIE